ncbi:hypothetical protein B9Z45_16385, partial [Limnohabitans sp. 2KL-17]|uniref:beta strand repeat-containing protein n=1 Tax=Limnohabitans sp. 2KL-17 TaxID=1100704 RepID=UPI000DD1EDF3
WEYSLDGVTWTTGTGSSFTATGDGTKSVQVRQIDKAGNASTPGTLSFTLDTTAPDVTIKTVTADNTVNATEATSGFTVGGTTTAEANQTISVWVSGYGSTLKTANVVAGANGLNTWQVTFTDADLPKDADGNILQGPISFEASVKDIAGNYGANYGEEVTVDTVVNSPEVTSEVPAAMNLLDLPDGKFTIRGNASEAGTITVTWKNANGSVATSENVQVNADTGEWSIDFADSNIPAGAVSFSVSFTDAHQNASAEQVFQVAVSSSFTVQGLIVAGPLTGNPGGDLVVDAYDANGALVGSTGVNNDGSYSLALTKQTRVVLKVRDTQPADSDVASYMDEATGATKTLPTLLAVVNIGAGSSMTVNITPLTDVAARMAGVTDTPVAPTNAAISSSNAAVSQLFLGGSDLLSTTPQATINANGTAATPDIYGVALATLSQMEASGNHSTEAVTQAIANGISITNGTASLSPALATVIQTNLKTLVSNGKVPSELATTLTGLVEVNDVPTGIVLSANTIKENVNVGAGVVIGTLTVIDPDASGNANVLTLGGTDAASFAIVGGQLMFTGTSPNFEAKSSYSVTVTSTDANGGNPLVYSQAFTVNVNDVNDAAVISGASVGAVTEAGGVDNATAGTPTATGRLTSTDADGTVNLFTAVTAGTASTYGYGTYTMSTAGFWTYMLNNSNATVQALAAEATLSDTFTVATADGTTQVVTVTITGTNDAAVIGGTSTAALTETNAVQTATGTLTSTDVDGTAGLFAAQTNVAGSNGFGKFSVTTGGAWTYTMNSAQNQFVAGTNYTDSITVATADGTTQVVTVTITAVSEAATKAAADKAAADKAVADEVIAKNTAKVVAAKALTEALAKLDAAKTEAEKVAAQPALDAAKIAAAKATAEADAAAKAAADKAAADKAAADEVIAKNAAEVAAAKALTEAQAKLDAAKTEAEKVAAQPALDAAKIAAAKATAEADAAAKAAADKAAADKAAADEVIAKNAAEVAAAKALTEAQAKLDA